MFFKRTFISLLFLWVLPLFFAPSVLAANAQVIGKIVDSTNLPLSASQIVIRDAATKKTVSTFQTDPFGNYIMQVPNGTYDITIIPPNGSGVSQLTKVNVTVLGNTTENIVMPGPSNLLKSRNDKVFGSVSAVVIYEIIAVVIIIVCFFVWKSKIMKFLK